MFSNVFQCYLVSLSLTISLSRYLTLSHSHTLSISHWITLDMLSNFYFENKAKNIWTSDKCWEPAKLALSNSLMLNNFCFHVYAQKSLSHSLTLTLSFSLSHSFNLSFIHSQHAEQLFFMSMLKIDSHTFSLSHSLTLFQSLIHSLSTRWTTFVFMSMLKSDCL